MRVKKWLDSCNRHNSTPPPGPPHYFFVVAPPHPNPWQLLLRSLHQFRLSKPHQHGTMQNVAIEAGFCFQPNGCETHLRCVCVLSLFLFRVRGCTPAVRTHVDGVWELPVFGNYDYSGLCTSPRGMDTSVSYTHS